jgi:molybdopterin-binding protein
MRDSAIIAHQLGLVAVCVGLASCVVFMSKTVTMGEAARALGVSVDTLRRWDRTGKLKTSRDGRNQRLVALSEIDRLSEAPSRHRTESPLSARNRFPGVVRSVEVSGVMALVEIEAGPYRITAAITRDSVEELGLREGMPATARVKATSVMVEKSV